MPGNITDVSTFTDPATRPADGDPVNAATFETPLQALANRTRWLKDRLASFIPESGGNAGEFVYASSKTRTIVVSLWDGAFNVVSSSDPWVRPGDANLATQYYWESTAQFVAMAFPLNGHLPDGAVIQTVKVIVDPSSAQATLTDRMLAALQYVENSFVASPTAPGVTSVAQAYDDGTANRQTITITPGGGHTVVKQGSSARDYTLLVFASVAASGDRINGIQITFTDPGPRNF